MVLGNTWAIQYDPLRYPDPETFRPERFLSHKRYAAEYAAMADPSERDHYAFGAGRRFCPGSRLAENTLNLALAHILWSFSLEPPAKDGKLDLSSDAWEETAFRPPKPFKLRVTPRNERRHQVLRDAWIEAKEGGSLS